MCMCVCECVRDVCVRFSRLTTSVRCDTQLHQNDGYGGSLVLDVCVVPYVCLRFGEHKVVRFAKSAAHLAKQALAQALAHPTHNAAARPSSSTAHALHTITIACDCALCGLIPQTVHRRVS